MGGITSGLLVPYPSFDEKSIYATVEPYDYKVNNILNIYLSWLIVSYLILFDSYFILQI